MTLQHQHGQGRDRDVRFARPAPAAVLGDEPPVLGPDQPVEGDRGFPGVGRTEVVREQGAHGRLRGFGAPPGIGDSVGYCRDQPARAILLRGKCDRREILVERPRTALAVHADVDVKTHRQGFAAVGVRST